MLQTREEISTWNSHGAVCLQTWCSRQTLEPYAQECSQADDRCARRWAAIML